MVFPLKPPSSHVTPEGTQDGSFSNHRPLLRFEKNRLPGNRLDLGCLEHGHGGGFWRLPSVNGLVEGNILQETPIFHGNIYGFRFRFSLKPIHWLWQSNLAMEGPPFMMRWLFWVRGWANSPSSCSWLRSAKFPDAVTAYAPLWNYGHFHWRMMKDSRLNKWLLPTLDW